MADTKEYSQIVVDNRGHELKFIRDKAEKKIAIEMKSDSEVYTYMMDMSPVEMKEVAQWLLDQHEEICEEIKAEQA
jgi:hypothetical protein